MKQANPMALFAVITAASVETRAANTRGGTVVVPGGSADRKVVEIGARPAKE